MKVTKSQLKKLINSVLLEYKDTKVASQIIGQDESERSIYFRALTNYQTYSNLFRDKETLGRIGVPVRVDDEFGKLFNSIFSGTENHFALARLLKNLELQKLFSEKELDMLASSFSDHPQQVLNDKDRSSFVEAIFTYFGKSPVEDWVPNDKQLDAFLKAIDKILVFKFKNFKSDIEVGGNLDYSFKKSKRELKEFIETLKLKSIGDALKSKSSTTTGAESTTDYKKRRIASNYLINNSKIVKDNFLITHFVGAYNRPKFYFHPKSEPGITDVISFAAAHLGKIKDDDESTVAIPKGKGNIAIPAVGRSKIGVIFGGDQMIVKGMYSGDVSTGRGDVEGTGVVTKSSTGGEEGFEKLPDKLGSKNYLDMLVIDPIEFKEKMLTPGSIESTRYNETITDNSQVVGFINISNDDWISLIEKEIDLINNFSSDFNVEHVNTSIQHVADAIEKISQDSSLKFINKDKSESSRDIVIEKLKLFKQALENLASKSLQEYVVPMGYSLKRWKKKKKKEKITNKEYAEKTKGDKWKVVHGHKKGKIGQPVNKSATNLSYTKANKMHAAIELNETLKDAKMRANRKASLQKALFTEYSYAIFQPFLAPLLYSLFGYIPPVNVPHHHRAELTPAIQRKIEDLTTGIVPPSLEDYRLDKAVYLPDEEKDYEVEFVTKSNFDDIKLESFSVEDIRKIIKEILSKI